MRKKSRGLAPVCSLLVCSFLIVLPGDAAPPGFTLALAGDVMLGRGVAQALGGDWEATLAQVAPVLRGSDLAFANLESLLTTAPQVANGHDLRAPPGAVAALRAGGFDLVSLANNHALDAGEAGLAETRQILRESGFAPLGDGERVCGPQWCLLALYTPLAEPQAAVEAVAEAGAAGRFLVVSLHWGGEYQASPSTAQRTLAGELAAAGADLVVGHGPHVLQRVDWFDGTLVAYSLGNLLFDQPYPADCRRGAILRVTVRGGRISATEAVPTVVERGRVRLAGPHDAATSLERLGLAEPGGLTFEKRRLQ